MTSLTLYLSRIFTIVLYGRFVRTPREERDVRTRSREILLRSPLSSTRPAGEDGTRGVSPRRVHMGEDNDVRGLDDLVVFMCHWQLMTSKPWDRKLT